MNFEIDITKHAEAFKKIVNSITQKNTDPEELTKDPADQPTRVGTGADSYTKIPIEGYDLIKYIEAID